MAVNWHNLAVASANLLEYERLCERRIFIDEASLVRASAEFIQSTTQLLLTPEHNHPDLEGNKRLDLVGRTRIGTPVFVAEAKWIKSGGGTRHWANEIIADILRLERLEQDVSVKTDRAIIVGGIGRSLRSNFLDVRVRTGNGQPTIHILPHILQPQEHHNKEFPCAQSQITIRGCDTRARHFWKTQGSNSNGTLLVSYQCVLAGFHKAGPSQDSVEVYVWLIRRSRNRAVFNVENALVAN